MEAIQDKPCIPQGQPLIYLQSRSRAIHIARTQREETTLCGQPIRLLTVLHGYTPELQNCCQRCVKIVEEWGLQPALPAEEMSDHEKMLIMWLAVDITQLRDRVCAMWEYTREGPRRKKLQRLIGHLNAAVNVLNE